MQRLAKVQGIAGYSKKSYTLWVFPLAMRVLYYR